MISISAFSTLGVLLGLLLIALPLYMIYRTDAKLFRQSTMVLIQLVGTGAVAAVCLHFLYVWNQWWCGLLFMVLVAVLSAFISARRSYVIFPLLVGSLSGTVVTGLIYLLSVLFGLDGMQARWSIPVLTLIVAYTTVITGRGLRAYHNARLSHPQLYDYLIGNGAHRLEALMPFIRKGMRQSIVIYLQQIKTYYLVGLPVLLCGLLMGGMSRLVSIFLVLEMVIAVLASSAIALMVGMLLMERK